MKFLLIAVYLAHGEATPRYETRGFTEKAACQALAADYVGNAVSGQKRAFCLPIKDRPYPVVMKRD